MLLQKKTKVMKMASTIGLAFPKKGDVEREKRISKKTDPEYLIQVAAENYLANLGCSYLHLSDELYIAIKAMYPEEVKNYKGVPDLLIFQKLEGSIFNLLCFLEIKTETGKVSGPQADWHRNKHVIVSYGLDDTITKIDEFLDFCRGINKQRALKEYEKQS